MGLCLKTLEEARQNGAWYLGRGRGTGAMYGSDTHDLADYPFAVPAGTRPPEIPLSDHKVKAPLTNAQAALERFVASKGKGRGGGSIARASGAENPQAMEW